MVTLTSQTRYLNLEREDGTSILIREDYDSNIDHTQYFVTDEDGNDLDWDTDLTDVERDSVMDF